MFNKRITEVTIWCVLLIHIQGTDHTETSHSSPIWWMPDFRQHCKGQYLQDQTSSRTNTLFDDADDIQRQLDNEARDRIKYGRPKTIWVFHLPAHFPDNTALDTENTLGRPPRETYFQQLLARRQQSDENTTPPLPPMDSDWEYALQNRWFKQFPECAGRSQSPVNLPATGLLKARGARHILFQNYDVEPMAMTLINDGKRVSLSGSWQYDKRPLIYGGALHSRRYLFHSFVIHWPSEHTVSGLQYPLETQALFVSAEYNDIESALNASALDPQAFLGIASLYKYGNKTHKGVKDILDFGKNMGIRASSFTPKPVTHFIPPFKEYAVYQGSLTTPPCSESVLWLVRGRTLPIMRRTMRVAQSLMPMDEPGNLHFRYPQPLNDRKVYLFD